jgi:hypothetical protein
VGDGGRLAAGRHSQLAEDVRHVDGHGLGANEQLVGDLAVGLAEREVLEDLALAAGEAELRK